MPTSSGTYNTLVFDQAKACESLLCGYSIYFAVGKTTWLRIKSRICFAAAHFVENLETMAKGLLGEITMAVCDSHFYYPHSVLRGHC